MEWDIDSSANLLRVVLWLAAQHIESIHADGAVGCGHESGDDSHRGGFTGAVRAEESENLAFLDLERDAFDCYFCRIAFREVFNCDQS